MQNEKVKDICLLYYIAGIVDGEGCIIISRTTRGRKYQRFAKYDLYVSVEMCEIDIPKMIYENFGGSLLLKYKQNPNHRDGLRWRLSSNQARDFLKVIQPYLLGKQEQARLGVKFQEYRNTAERFGRGHRKPLDRVRKEEEMYQEMKCLNHTNWWESKKNAK